ncbi:hypothetical protein Y032_0012g1657 [Ancylostoma ceylanicum]|uniref:Uncharacterized protein n=1 Tax=Ancylostoma ceylanicum TaxID=53326 RepID=A0A016VCT2_9BILA|nr:hypothetical protein Y032_0012g1657 [Ancylostoma ceylanicum]
MADMPSGWHRSCVELLGRPGSQLEVSSRRLWGMFLPRGSSFDQLSGFLERRESDHQWPMHQFGEDQWVCVEYDCCSNCLLTTVIVRLSSRHGGFPELDYDSHRRRM